MATLGDRWQALAGRFLPALRYREYRTLWSAALCSQSSAWALIVARGALALTLTDSAFWPAMVTYAAMIPSVVISPFAGYLADRFDRRTVLAWAYTFNLIHAILLAFLVVTGSIQVWHLVLLAVFNGTFRSIQMPAAQALLANTVPKERIFNGVALFQAAQHGSRFLGPLLILLTLWITGREDWVFFVSAGLYAIGLVLVLSIRTRSRGVLISGAGVGSTVRNMVAGLSYIYRSPTVLSLMILVVAHCALTMSFESLFPVLSRDKLGMAPGAGFMAGFGYMMVAYGGTAFLAAMGLAGIRSERLKGRLFLALAVASSISPFALGLSPNLGLAVLSVAAMGASQAGFMTLSQGMLQTMAPDATRGRIMSVYSWHILGFMATFNLINGTLAAVTPLTASLILVTGAVGFLIVIASSLGRASMRQIYGGQYQQKAAEARA